LSFKPNVATLRPQVATQQVAKLARQDLTQPAQPFPFARASKLRELAMGLQEGFLYQVRGIHFTLQAPADLQSRQQREIMAVQLHQLSQGNGIPGPRLNE